MLFCMFRRVDLQVFYTNRLQSYNKNCTYANMEAFFFVNNCF